MQNWVSLVFTIVLMPCIVWENIRSDSGKTWTFIGFRLHLLSGQTSYQLEYAAIRNSILCVRRLKESNLRVLYRATLVFQTSALPLCQNGSIYLYVIPRDSLESILYLGQVGRSGLEPEMPYGDGVTVRCDTNSAHRPMKKPPVWNCSKQAVRVSDNHILTHHVLSKFFHTQNSPCYRAGMNKERMNLTKTLCFSWFYSFFLALFSTFRTLRFYDTTF